MEIKEILSGGKTPLKFEIPEITNSSETSESQILEGIGKEKIQSLEKSIENINALIEEREDLSEKFIEESEDIKTETNNFLLENENVKDMDKSDLIKEKNSIRNKKIEISELQLKEKIDCWKDVALLKKELRQNEKELSEKQARLTELNNLMREE